MRSTVAARANNTVFRAAILFLVIAFGLAAGYALGHPGLKANGAAAAQRRKGVVESDPWEQLPHVSFPGSRNRLASPNRHYLLENVDCDDCDSATTYPHTIYLIDTKRHARRMLYHYGRWVNVLWSPSSQAVAINDFCAADDSRSVLFVLGPRLKRIDLSKTLLMTLRPGTDYHLLSGGYPVFKFVVRWLDSRSLLFKATGFAEAGSSGFKRPFTLIYAYRVQDSFVPYSGSNASDASRSR